MRVLLGFSTGAMMRPSNPDSWHGSNCLVAIVAHNHPAVILHLPWLTPRATKNACGDAHASLTSITDD